ncbi:MAG: hypothetical protein ACRYF5_15460 [Janthinobacterium lividum]
MPSNRLPPRDYFTRPTASPRRQNEENNASSSAAPRVEIRTPPRETRSGHSSGRERNHLRSHRHDSRTSSGSNFTRELGIGLVTALGTEYVGELADRHPIAAANVLNTLAEVGRYHEDPAERPAPITTSYTLGPDERLRFSYDPRNGAMHGSYDNPEVNTWTNIGRDSVDLFELRTEGREENRTRHLRGVEYRRAPGDNENLSYQQRTVYPSGGSNELRSSINWDQEGYSMQGEHTAEDNGRTTRTGYTIDVYDNGRPIRGNAYTVTRDGQLPAAGYILIYRGEGRYREERI